MKRDVSVIMPADAVKDAKRAFPDVTTCGLKLTDFGNAERLVARHGRDLRYVHPWKKALAWDERRWAFDDTAEIERRAKMTVRSMYEEAAKIDDDGVRTSLIKHAKESESASKISAMIRLATSEPGIPALPRELDADPWLLTCENGTVDLRSGELREHRREDLITRLVPITYNAAAECPTWRRFLSDVMAGNEKLIAFLQRSAGYTLTGITREQVLFFAIGPGSNGKTTFLRLLLKLLGEYGGQAAPDLLLAKKGEVHPTEQADLFGKRLAVCTEIEQGRAWAEVTVKQLTGEDQIKARRMREDFWGFDATHKFWIGANHKPIVKGTDHAIWRRLLLIPFAVTFDGARKDPTLVDKLTAELPGILRWAVDGCLAWQRDGLQPPDEVLAEVARYREEMDVLGSFLEERCKREQNATIKAGDLYRAYAEWCEASGERAVKQRSFGLAMTERRFVKKPVNGYPTYQDLRLRGFGEPGEEGDHGDEVPSYPAQPPSRMNYTGRSSPSSPSSPLSETTVVDNPAGDIANDPPEQSWRVRA